MGSEIKELSDQAFQVLRTVNPDPSWVSQEILQSTADKVYNELEDCHSKAERFLEEIFSQSCNVELNTSKTRDLIQAWHDGRDEFSAPAIILYVVDVFNLQNHPELVKCMMAAALLAEVNNDQPYHNNQHFRKVLLHVVRMIVTHNKMFKNNAGELIPACIAKLVTAACIHDLGHNGSSNIIDRKYHMAMLERRSYELAYPFLKATGVNDEFLEDVLIMLIGTDTSPFGDPISPSNQIKVAYEYHYGIYGQGGLNLSEELRTLEEDHRLTLLCVMLHEADIMNSAGVDYDITRYESVSVSKEYGESGAYPEYTLLFLEKVCHGGFLSDAGSYLADDNLAAIKARIMQDFKDGNQSYV